MNLIEISNKFPTEKDAILFFEQKRWGKKPKCAYCESLEVSDLYSDNRRNCKTCGKGFSVTVGTNFQGTKIPLKTWLYAIAIITDAKKGLSAKQLERNLGVHYETAWNMYMKLRKLMDDENNQIELTGVIEMDETYIGGKPRKQNNPLGLKQKNQPELNQRIEELKAEGISFKAGKGNFAKPAVDIKRGRGTKKIPVVGIVQRNGDVIAEVMRHTTHENLKALIKKYVDVDDSVLVTDEYSGYNRFSRLIEHVAIDHQKMYSYKGINTNTIESFWAIIKRGITGQYHKVSLKYLPDYINEFVFKYNNRNKDQMFETLINNALQPAQKK